MVKRKRKFSPTLFTLLLLLATLSGVLVFSASIQNVLQDNLVPQAACGSKNPLGHTGIFDPKEFAATWLGESVTPLSQELALSQEAQNLASAQVLGETSEEKWIEVDLTEQRVRARKGNQIVYEFPMSSGKFAHTPTGEYRIWYKVKYTKMEGGVKGTGTYYYLPNVPYVMFFNQGYGFHGTYWHNNFGTPMSHGCVNLSISNAEKLFYWAGPALPGGKKSTQPSEDNPGTRVVVHGTTPRT